MNRVRAGFFSLTPPSPPDDDGSYLRWHLLDHMPEQYSIPGVVLGSRWIADGEYGDHVIVASHELGPVGGVVSYLFADPVQQTYDEFMALGAHLAVVGRFPERRPSLQTRLHALADAHAAPSAKVSAEVLPFRPHRGVLLVIEDPAKTTSRPENIDPVLAVDGVAGIWSFVATNDWTVLPSCQGEPQRVTLIYLDRDPLETTATLRPLLEQQWDGVAPAFAAPFRTMVRWDAWQ